MSLLIGFDIGGTKCAIVLGALQHDESIKILDKQVITTVPGPQVMITAMFDVADQLLLRNRVSIDSVTGIGISCGGPLDSRNGVILSPPNLPGWTNIPLVEITQQRFTKPARMQNDANACAVAEWKYGVGKGYTNLIFLTFGTGMGAGLILNGQLYSGTCDLAGEIGHLRLADHGPVGFGKAGSFEGFCSGGGIAQLAQSKVREKLQVGISVSMCPSIDDLPLLTAKKVADAAYAGDELAKEIYQTCGHYLGKGLSVLIDLLNPEIIILGSIYGRAKELFSPSMEAAIRKEAIGYSSQVCRIEAAGLGESIGDMAALVLALPNEKSKPVFV